MNALATAMRDFWLSDGSLTIEQENRMRLALRKVMAESGRTANHSKQWEQLKKLMRFYRQATFGPALSTSSKRSRVALFLKEWRLFVPKGAIKHGQQLLDPLKHVQKLGPILEALDNGDDQAIGDLAIAVRFEKTRSAVNVLLAQYSLVMVGQQPVLTFGEMQKILGWISPRDLRAKIRELRKEYGEWAVPLKPGRVGRPRKKSSIQKK